MNWLSALILGLLEGLTEFLPVSSTGHLILANHVLGLKGEGAESFTIVIQLGALIAAMVYYRQTLQSMLGGLWKSEAQAVRLSVGLLLAASPALALGYLFGKRIKAVLFGPVPVALALIVGGVVMIAVDHWQKRRSLHSPQGALDNLTLRQAAVVGITQAAALFPGTSRSMASILGGQLSGMSNAAAADFAFLLAIPTLGAATLYDLLKHRDALLSQVGAMELGLGLLTSFVVGYVVIAAFLRFLRRFGMAAFGYYRIVLGVVVFVILN